MPSVRLEDECTPFNAGTVAVPVFIRNDYFADGLQLTIDCETDYVQYEWYFFPNDDGDWRVDSVLSYGNQRTTLVLRKNFKAEARESGEEVVALYTVFSLQKPSAEGQPFRIRTKLSIGNDLDPTQTDMSYFFVLGDGEAHRPITTRLQSGHIVIYFHDGLEAGGGAVTKTEQDFTLPLYLTYLGKDRQVFSVGVDYDEVFLNLVGVRGKSPPLAKKAIEVSSVDLGQNWTRAKFKLELAKGTSGPLCRTEVAQLNFHYDGLAPPDTGLLIQPKLLSEPLQEGAPDEGGGASYGENIPGVVKLLPAYFVRGNADSSVSTGPDGKPFLRGDLTDAILILKAIFLGRSEIACEDAADVNNNGVIEISDAISLLNHVWRGGPPPMSPYPDPGLEPETEDDLSCDKPLPLFKPLGEDGDK